MTRNPDAAGLPPEVEVMSGDLGVPETLDRCLGGIDTVFLVWTAAPDAVAPALERIARYARRIVFLVSSAQNATSALSTTEPATSDGRANRATDRDLRARVDVPTARNVGRKRLGLVGFADSRR